MSTDAEKIKKIVIESLFKETGFKGRFKNTFWKKKSLPPSESRDQPHTATSCSLKDVDNVNEQQLNSKKTYISKLIFRSLPSQKWARQIIMGDMHAPLSALHTTQK